MTHFGKEEWQSQLFVKNNLDTLKKILNQNLLGKSYTEVHVYLLLPHILNKIKQKSNITK